MEILKTIKLKNGTLCISKGSILDFQGDAIVNAVNEACLGGRGVDKAITNAGGVRLQNARRALKVKNGVRCPIGEARVTSSGDIATVKWIIHAVGPDYRGDKSRWSFLEKDGYLEKAYRDSMKKAKLKNMKKVAFPLLSAGIFRGTRSLDDVMVIAVRNVADCLTKSSYGGMEVTLVTYDNDSCDALVRAADDYEAGVVRLRDYDLKFAIPGGTKNSKRTKNNATAEKKGSLSKRAQKVAGVGKKKTPGVGKKTPGVGKKKTPGVGKKTPGVGKKKTPGVGKKTPGVGKKKTPGVGKKKTPGVGKKTTPGDSKKRTPGVGKKKTPGVGKKTTPGDAKKKTPGVGKKTTPGDAKKKTRGVGKKKDRATGSRMTKKALKLNDGKRSKM